MKKKLIAFLVLGAMLAISPSMAMAGTFTVDFGNHIAVMDGQKVIMKNVAGVSEDGVMLVPVRAIAEAYDGTVTYHADANSVYMTFPNGNWANIKIEAPIGIGDSVAGDGIVSIGTFIDDRLYIPATLMATCLGARVEAIDYGSDHVYRLIYHVR